MRLLVFATILAFVTGPALAQYPETGGDPDDNPGAVKARPLGDPGASQDAEAARLKLLKASDQIDQVAANSEATKAALESLKTQLAQIQADNTALKAQVSTLQDTVAKQQDALAEERAARIKEREKIINDVASLVAGKPAAHHSHAEDTADGDTPSAVPPAHKQTADITADTETPTRKLDAALDSTADNSGPVKYPASPAKIEAQPASDAVATSHEDTSAAKPTAPVVHHKGYYHVVQPHETLSMICEAYRDHGVKVTVSEIRKANGLTAKSTLKSGQKLFIPKPGT